MGRGIAQVFAVAGYHVILYDVDESIVDEAMFHIGQRLAARARNARLAHEESEKALKRIRVAGDLSLLKDSDLVIEAVPEDMALKKQVLAQLEAICGERTIFATGTSGFSVTELARATKFPERVIGLHFFHPVPVMQLVEVIRGAQTDQETFETAMGIVEEIGKTAIAVQDSPLFVVNRILVPMLNEAIFVLQDGLASKYDIDAGMKLGANHPVGPLALADMVGLDTLLAVSESLLAETGDTKYRPPLLLRQMVRAGKLGRKSGEGFYTYRDGVSDAP